MNCRFVLSQDVEFGMVILNGSKVTAGLREKKIAREPRTCMVAIRPWRIRGISDTHRFWCLRPAL